MTVLPTRTALAAALALALGAVASTAPAATPIVVASQPTIDSIDAARGVPNLLILRTGVFDPAAQQLDVSAVGAAPAATTSAYAIVQFQPGRLDERKALAARGVEFLGYVPNNAYYVRLGNVKLSDLTQNPAVRWAGSVQPAMKLDPALWQAQRATSAALQADGSYEVLVEGFKGVSSAVIQSQLAKSVPGLEVVIRSERAEASPYVHVRVKANELDALLHAATAAEGVAFISPWLENVVHNAGGIAALQGNFTGTCAGSGPICGPNKAPLFDQGITGSGQIVAVADSGTTPNAAWFATLDKGNGPHTEVTFAENPPPVLPNIGTLHPDNKIIAYWTQPGGPVDYDYTSGHGTHTTGTVVGDAAGTFGATTYMPATPLLPNHDLADGMAPGAQLLMQDIGGADARTVYVQDFEGTLQQAHGGGARIHSDSWGAPTSGQYSSNDQNLDRITRKFEDLLVVVSAGNDQAGARAVGSPGNSKNGLTIAALGHAGSLAKASFSNAGPTADGRMKPDVSAPGSSTISAKNSTASTPVSSTILAPATRPDSGTSMSAPTVSGNAVLLRQYFTDGFYPRGFRNEGGAGDFIFVNGFDDDTTAPPASGELVDAYNPTGSIMKAVLLNGTVPTTNPAAFPNTGTGWGRVWLDGNLWFKNTMPGGDDSRRLRLFERTNAAGLKTGDVNEYTIANVAAGVEFRATLTWFDVPAAVGAASTLVNNLDLEVVGPDGQTYLGNHFSGNVTTPGGTADTKDTVEQVRLTTPVAGSYTIRVRAKDVPGDGSDGSDRQGYGLAVSGRFGMPDPAPFPAPTALNVASNDSSGVKVTASAASGAQSYQLYRADNVTCAAAQTGDFHMVANGTALPLIDDTTQGGFQYAYKLRGVQNDVEGDASACVDVVSQDTCTLHPTFDAHSLVGNSSHSSCSVDLSWSAAQSSCPLAQTVTYKVERDTSPYFGNPQVIAPAATSTSISDSAVSNGTAYFYRVTAADGAGNTTPSIVLNATPSGVDGPDPGSYLDDVDTHSYALLQTPWQVTNVAASAGTLSYHNATDSGAYPDLTCASLTTPSLKLTTGAALSFQARYDMEYQWDGVVTEISTDGGTTWTDLPPTGGYPDTFAHTQDQGDPGNACGFLATHGAFTGVSTAASNNDPNNGTAAAVFKPFTTDLSSYVGQTVKIRWRMSSDPNTNFQGFFLDQVAISGAAGTGDYMCH